MDDLESQLLQNLSNVAILKQLIEKLHDDSQTKRMKTAESLCKVFEEYKSSGVLELKNSITEFLWTVFAQIIEACVKGLTGKEDKFQAAWALVMLRLLKVHSSYQDLAENTHFVALVSQLFVQQSFKVLGFLIREFQDLAVTIVEGLTGYFKVNLVLAENFVGLAKALPGFDRIKANLFWDNAEVKVPSKRKRTENIDPALEKNKILVDVTGYEYIYKESISKLWVTVLNQGLRESEIKVYLKIIPKIGFSQVQDALIFSDFYLKSFDLGGNLSVLALNGMFILCTRHNLESKLYYNKLYTLLKKLLSNGKPLKKNFLRLIELSLSSHLLPASLVASFLRLFLKESIRASTHQTLWSLALALKCLKIHPVLSKMLHNDSQTDTFNLESNDPLHTNAIENSFWELQILNSHWNPQIKQILKEFEKNVEKIPKISPSEIEKEESGIRAEIQAQTFEALSLFN